jgi:hypothetical protein
VARQGGDDPVSLAVEHGVVDPDSWYLVERTRGSRRFLQGPWAPGDRQEAERALELERRERARKPATTRRAVGEGGDW